MRPFVVVVEFGDDREDAGHADAVRTHRDGHELAVLVEDLEPERLGVLAAELEHVADLHAARERDRAGAVGGGVALAHGRDLDETVGGEVAAGDERVHVLLVDVRAGDPARAVDDARVEQVADAGGRLLAEDRAGRRPRSDIALHEQRVALEVFLGRGLDRRRARRRPRRACRRCRGRPGCRRSPVRACRRGA